MVRRRLHEMQALALRMGVRDDRAPGPQGGASPFCFSHRPSARVIGARPMAHGSWVFVDLTAGAAALGNKKPA